MHDWNIVVTIHQGHYHEARRFLETFGRLSQTDYFNVLVLKVDDLGKFLEDMDREFKMAPTMNHLISRVMPATVTFDFQKPAEFEAQVRRALPTSV